MSIVAQDVEKLKQAFGDREFKGKDVARVLGMEDFRGSGAIVKTLRREKIAYQTLKGWRFGTPQAAPVATTAPEAAQVSAPVATELVSMPPALVQIGELYLHERLLLIADKARQEGSPAVRLYTTIIEIDPASKHPRNKIVNFVKSRDPREYAQAVAWIDSLAGVPHAADDTALELAAELEQKLNAANQEIAELKARIKNIRAAFAEATI